VGHRFDSLQHRQRPNLTETKHSAASIEDGGAADPAIRFVVLALLAVDGVLSALMGALFLPLYVGSVPLPVSGLLSGLLNALLVWAAGRWTRSAPVAGLPLWTWLITVALLCMGGPGDDIILGGHGFMAYGALWLIVLGVYPPARILLSRNRYV
jgi:hypothetical protein